MKCTRLLIPRLFLSATIALGISGGAHAAPRYSFPLSDRVARKLKVDIQRDRAAFKLVKGVCNDKKLSVTRGDCDADRDGLLNAREKLLRTNPLLKDSDFDGLTDLAEVTKYRLNPTKVDNPNGGCYPLYFDKAGNTIQFTLPKRVIGNLKRGKALYQRRCVVCHSAEEKGNNRTFTELKSRLAAAPMLITDLKDGSIGDLVAYLHRTLAGQGACQTLPPAPSPTPTGIVGAPGCANDFFTAEGDTTAFGIPSPLTGNLTRGAAYFAASCSSCHGDRGANFSFTQAKAAVTGPLMNITNLSDATLADLTAYFNRASAPQNCGSVPSPTPTQIPANTATPAPQATLPPLGCSNQFFDANGNTSSFGIPAPLLGNISAGSSYYSLACSSCHGERGTNSSFSALKTAVTGPLMNIKSLTDQQFANLVAFLNRSSAPQNCTSPPAPTPTPIDDITAGSIVFQTSCATCHTRINDDLRQLTKNKLLSAIKDVKQMRSIVLSNEQIRVLLLYLHSR